MAQFKSKVLYYNLEQNHLIQIDQIITKHFLLRIFLFSLLHNEINLKLHRNLNQIDRRPAIAAYLYSQKWPQRHSFKL